MNDVVLKRVVLHDDAVPVVYSGTTISVRYDEAAPFLKEESVGEVEVISRGWLPKETEIALAESTYLIRQIIKDCFLAQPEFEIWRTEEERVKIGMASKCIYLIISKPSNSPITLRPSSLPYICERINNAQNLFEIQGGKILSGGPDGGTLQFAYKLNN